jgi:hypothetical protein
LHFLFEALTAETGRHQRDIGSDIIAMEFE